MEDRASPHSMDMHSVYDFVHGLVRIFMWSFRVLTLTQQEQVKQLSGAVYLELTLVLFQRPLILDGIIDQRARRVVQFADHSKPVASLSLRRPTKVNRSGRSIDLSVFGFCTQVPPVSYWSLYRHWSLPSQQQQQAALPLPPQRRRPRRCCRSSLCVPLQTLQRTLGGRRAPRRHCCCRRR